MAKKSKKSKLAEYLLKKATDVTIGGGIGVDDNKYVTIPSGKVSLEKGKKYLEVGASKPFSKFDKENINSEISLSAGKTGENSSYGVTGTKSGKDKSIMFTFSKKLNPKKIKKRSIGGSMLKGNQVKLDKDGDGKISGNDFKLMPKPKKAVLGLAAAVTKKGRKFIKKLMGKKLEATSSSKGLPIGGGEGSPLLSMYQKATKQKTARHGGYMKKANKGMMMNKPSTRGFGAARTSGMGLENEALQPGKIYDKVKAKKGKMAKASMGEFITVSEYSEDLI